MKCVYVACRTFHGWVADNCPEFAEIRIHTGAMIDHDGYYVGQPPATSL